MTAVLVQLLTNISVSEEQCKVLWRQCASW